MRNTYEMKRTEMRKMRASLTIEASILIPLALFMIVGGINIGFDLFQQARSASEIREELEELDPIEIVRKKTLVQELKK